jgi:hypothetical protein
MVYTLDVSRYGSALTAIIAGPATPPSVNGIQLTPCRVDVGPGSATVGGTVPDRANAWWSTEIPCQPEASEVKLELLLDGVTHHATVRWPEPEPAPKPARRSRRG